MDSARIARALGPFIPEGTLSDAQLSQVSAYLDLLLKWNAKINLTAVRSVDEILTRHFGESFFLARQLSRLYPEIVIPSAARLSVANERKSRDKAVAFEIPQFRSRGPQAAPILGRLGWSSGIPQLSDLGSGAGFPGIPVKIYAPHLSVTLIESNQKKATFLREVIRTLKLTNINVFAARAEEYVEALHKPDGQTKQISKSANEQIIVTLRAVEHFDRILPLAAQIANHKLQITNSEFRSSAVPQFGNVLALLIGFSQLPTVHRLLPHFSWDAPLPIPLSRSRILLLGHPLELSS